MTLPTFTLNNGVELPAIGFGTWGGLQDDTRKDVQGVVLSAIQNGYRHIDTAWNYRTEKYVGAAIKESGVPRKDLFITTKLSWTHQGPRVPLSFNDSLRDLGVDYVDLYLIHWPQSFSFDETDEEKNVTPNGPDGNPRVDDTTSFVESWKELEKIYKSGKARAIGVSNFSVKTLKELLKHAEIVPAVNQVELHPHLGQEELRRFCDEKGIHITAYTPTGWQSVREDPVLLELAQKYNSSPVQVTLAWHIARGVDPCTRSDKSDRQKQSLELPTLEAADIERISKLDKNKRYCNSPNEKGEVWGWSLERLGW